MSIDRAVFSCSFLHPSPSIKLFTLLSLNVRHPFRFLSFFLLFYFLLCMYVSMECFACYHFSFPFFSSSSPSSWRSLCAHFAFLQRKNETRSFLWCTRVLFDWLSKKKPGAHLFRKEISNLPLSVKVRRKKGRRMKRGVAALMYAARLSETSLHQYQIDVEKLLTRPPPLKNCENTAEHFQRLIRRSNRQ